MDKNLEKYFLEACGAKKNELSQDNPYRQIGFDGEKSRLGWVKSAEFSRIKKSLEGILPLLEGKDKFIFVGMGGSINGIKPLLFLSDKRFCYTLDNLDPEAIESLLKSLGSLDRTLVVAISKSGTTKETQLLASAMRELFSNSLGEQGWRKNFIWLSDPNAFSKLDELGWQGVPKTAIQFDGNDDIGGRFSSPNTLIFFLPLFLILKKNFCELENIYNSFLFSQDAIRSKAFHLADEYKDKAQAYFSPMTGEKMGASFSSWIVQLFQESLGSKLEGLEVKTLPNSQNADFFSPVELGTSFDCPIVEVISQMYFFQVFVAYYSAFKKINFVSQEFVEKYKFQMRKLQEREQGTNLEVLSLGDIIESIRKKIKPDQKFIEIVLYFYPSAAAMTDIQKKIENAFKDKTILVFIGSDWNHQSYQAAFGSKDTFYLLLLRPKYKLDFSFLPPEIFKHNIETLKVISEATYLTLRDKSLLLAYSN